MVAFTSRNYTIVNPLSSGKEWRINYGKTFIFRRQKPNRTAFKLLNRKSVRNFLLLLMSATAVPDVIPPVLWKNDIINLWKLGKNTEKSSRKHAPEFPFPRKKFLTWMSSFHHCLEKNNPFTISVSTMQIPLWSVKVPYTDSWIITSSQQEILICQEKYVTQKGRRKKISKWINHAVLAELIRIFLLLQKNILTCP